jgi:UDP-glucose 4-epimerase
MRVVVTGGAGFIGANLCRRLVETDGIDEVVAYDNLSTGSKENLVGVDGVDLVEADLCDRAALEHAFQHVSTVVHLAARPSVPKSITDPVASHVANVTGTLEVLEAARRAGRPHVIAASSSSVYGANPTLPKHEELKPSPLSPYAAMKLATETYTLAWGHSFGLDVLAFRFFNVFGPFQPAGHAYAAVVPAFVSAALEGRPLPVHGNGEQTRDFTYVGSVTSVLTEAVVRRVSAPEPVNLAFGSRTSLLELITVLEDVLSRSLDRQHSDPRAGDVRDSQADMSRLQSLFPGVEPVPLVEGIKATVDWFRAQRS